jgi:hypothetical protein
MLVSGDLCPSIAWTSFRSRFMEEKSKSGEYNMIVFNRIFALITSGTPSKNLGSLCLQAERARILTLVTLNYK